MEKEYWHLGTVEKCTRTITIKPGQANLQEAVEQSDGVFFTDGIAIDGHVWVPLESFSKKMEIPRDYMLTDGFLEVMNKIAKRDGVFPIQKLDGND